MTPTFRTTGNNKSWLFHSGSKSQSTLGGKLESKTFVVIDRVCWTIVILATPFVFAFAGGWL